MDEEQGLEEAVRALGFAGLRVDGPRGGVGTLIAAGGEGTPVFVRWARSPGRFAAEVSALQRLEWHLGARAPAPRLIAAMPDLGAGVVIMAYEPGANLADFLPPDAPIPSLPLTYLRSDPGSAGDLAPALEEAGRAVRLVHGIPLERFGKPEGENPNPYRDDARRHTEQEAHHALSLCAAQGWFDGTVAGRIERWLGQYLPLIDGCERPCFVHFDLHAGNIRLAPRPGGGWRFQSLLDWELARGWLPECDLALLSWYLPSAWWAAFLRGYGPVRAERVRLFEMIKVLGMMAYSKDPADWGGWGCRRLNVLLERP